MNIVRMILKEAGGRFENAAGSIDSKDNMFRGSSGNAISDKLGGGEQNNPVMEEEPQSEGAETPDMTTETDTTPAESADVGNASDVNDNENIMSDGRLKDGYADYKNTYKELESRPLSGKLKNLDLNPTSQKPTTSNGSGGGGMGGMMQMFQGIGGSGAEGAGDMGGGADMADMGDMADAGDAADAASDERLKRIFGDNEDAIKCFANINAIKFTYNDKAHDIPGGEDKGIDNDPHYGVKAQELAENPLTQTAVSKDPISEYLQVDTKELTMANTAIISEICKRILIIEKVLGIKVV